jgi:hypothetical protein
LYLVEQTTKALYLLLSKSNNGDLPFDLMLKLFDRTVLPVHVLIYDSEIFGFENHDQLEKVHNDFLRKLTKAKKSTQMYIIYGELERYTIAINVQPI